MKPERRIALVTGSTRGIGLGVATALARAGYDIALHGSRHSAAADHAVQVVTEAAQAVQGAVRFFPADLAQASAAPILLDQVFSHFGGLHVLVNNAGIQHVCPVQDFSDERWDELMNIHLGSAFRLIRGAVPALRDQRWGRIINMSSVHGLVASVHKAAYVAAKHGLVGLTRVVALETAGDGITCNAICPGWVLTDLVRAQLEAKASARGIGMEQASEELLAAKQPMKRFTTVEAVGDMAVFLCSEAGATITGAALTMDGGWTAV